MRKTVTFISIALLFAAVSCTSLTSGKSEEIQRTISVSGTGTVLLQADMVTFSVRISETAQTTALAQQETNRKISEVLAILRRFGIEDKYISTASLSFSSDYYWDGNTGKQVKSGEIVSQTVYATMTNLDDFAPLADALGSEITGISFYNVTFNSSSGQEASDQARAMAYEDAVKKASIYAQAAGMKLGNPVSVSDGYSSCSSSGYSNDGVMMAKAESAISSYATETPTGQLSVSSTVEVVFELVD